MSRDAMTDLKPCPFCGGKPYDCQHLTYSNWGVGCSCGARGPTFNAGYRPMRDAEIRAHDDAIAAWNTRAALAQPEQPTCPHIRSSGSGEWATHWCELNGPPAAQPEAVSQFARGINAAARLVEQRRADYDAEHGSTDPETGTREYPGTGDEYVCELDEIAEAIRALAPPPSAPCPHIRSSGTGGWATNWCELNGPPAAQPSDAELERRTGEPHVDGWPLYSGLPPAAKPAPRDAVTDEMVEAAWEVLYGDTLNAEDGKRVRAALVAAMGVRDE